jgi:hypothetical protein
VIKGNTFPEALKKTACDMTTMFFNRMAGAAVSPLPIHFSCTWPCEDGFFADNYTGRN